MLSAGEMRLPGTALQFSANVVPDAGDIEQASPEYPAHLEPRLR